MGHWGTCPPRLPTFSFLIHFVVGLTLTAKYCVVCEISWWNVNNSHSISTELVTKLLVINQLQHPALKFAVSAPWHNFSLCPSSQQILATPLKISACDVRCYSTFWTDLEWEPELRSFRASPLTVWVPITVCVCLYVCGQLAAVALADVCSFLAACSVL